MSDLISRQAAIDALGDAHFKNYGNAIMVIQDLPSAYPKNGKWIPCDKSGLILTEQLRREGVSWYGFKCSACNSVQKGNALREANYCPNCGARMDEE